MPIAGRCQIQLRAEEKIVIQIALEKLVKDKSLSPIEKAIAESTLSHVLNSKMH